MSASLPVEYELESDELEDVAPASPESPASTGLVSSRHAFFAGGALFGLLLVASVVLGQVAPSRAKAVSVRVAPRTARLEAATAMETRPPALFAAKARRSSADNAEAEADRVFTPGMLPAPSSSSSSPSSSFSSSSPSPSPSPSPSLSPSSAQPVHAGNGVTTGFLRVPSSVNGVLIDGSPHRVAGGLQVTCGWHKVKTPQHPARSVNVPCGGTAML